MSLLRRGPRRPKLQDLVVPVSREAAFVQKHADADCIVHDTVTGALLGAEYTTFRGKPRQFPVTILFNGGAECI